MLSKGGEILDFSAIPSSASLVSLESAPLDDIRYFKKKKLEIRAKITQDTDANDELKDINPKDPEPEI